MFTSYYVIPPCVQDIGNGIQLFPQVPIVSKTFGCFLDAQGTFRYGYIYKNGSNYRVVSWKNGLRKNRTVPRWASIFVFTEVTTPYPFSSPDFSANDFTFPWFDLTAQMILQNALMVWKKMEFDNLINQMAKLSLSQRNYVYR